MDRILIILKKKKKSPGASSAPALGLNTIIFKHVYWFMQQISGERLQDHWSSCITIVFKHLRNPMANQSQILYEASIGRGNLCVHENPGHMTKMATMPIYG